MFSTQFYRYLFVVYHKLFTFFCCFFFKELFSANIFPTYIESHSIYLSWICKWFVYNVLVLVALWSLFFFCVIFAFDYYFHFCIVYLKFTKEILTLHGVGFCFCLFSFFFFFFFSLFVLLLASFTWKQNWNLRPQRERVYFFCTQFFYFFCI